MFAFGFGWEGIWGYLGGLECRSYGWVGGGGNRARTLGLLGPDLGSEELFSQTKPALLALSATVRGVRTEVSPEVVGGC